MKWISATLLFDHDLIADASTKTSRWRPLCRSRRRYFERTLDKTWTETSHSPLTMAEDGAENKFLAPAAVTALKQQAKQETPAGVQMERSISQDIREEREDLKEAAEQTLNVILDLGLDGHIRWVSPSWAEVVGTPLDSVRGKPIADFVLDNPSAFRDAVESMKKDDSKSQIIRFSVRMGPNSVLKSASEQEKDGEDGPKDEGPEVENFLNLEGQGIMVYDRASGGESHVSPSNDTLKFIVSFSSFYRLCGCCGPLLNLEKSPLTFLL